MIALLRDLPRPLAVLEVGVAKVEALLALAAESETASSAIDDTMRRGRPRRLAGMGEEGGY